MRWLRACLSGASRLRTRGALQDRHLLRGRAPLPAARGHDCAGRGPTLGVPRDLRRRARRPGHARGV
eukprot:6149923-Lingulodinium_polyedra.AAC.1